MKIEDIREKQAVEAERHIRAQFKMEKIVYCQDDLYIGDLNTVKAQNAFNGPAGTTLQSQISPNDPSVVVEMVSHTSAYFSVSSQADLLPPECHSRSPSARSCWSQYSLVCPASTVQGIARGISVSHSGTCSASLQTTWSFWAVVRVSGQSWALSAGCRIWWLEKPECAKETAGS